MTNAPQLSRAGKDGVIQDTGKLIQNHSPTEPEDTGRARVLMFMGLTTKAGVLVQKELIFQGLRDVR